MKNHIDIAMRENLELMHQRLAVATGHVSEALGYILKGERNAAIGSMPGTDELLQDALALFTATRALHRAGGRS